jgi:hypothetical protein
MTYSRRVKRLRAGWDGICRIEGEPGERRCRIDDVSMLGLGVTFADPSPSRLAGRRISVDVPAMAQFEGEITHAEAILGGAVRVGVMFKDRPEPAFDRTAPQSTVGERSGS